MVVKHADHQYKQQQERKTTTEEEDKHTKRALQQKQLALLKYPPPDGARRHDRGGPPHAPSRGPPQTQQQPPNQGQKESDTCYYCGWNGHWSMDTGGEEEGMAEGTRRAEDGDTPMRCAVSLNLSVCVCQLVCVCVCNCLMFKRCNVLNPATLLPTLEKGNPHDCVAELLVSCSPRLDLMDQPLINPDLVLFVDGSASQDPDTGRCKAGYAVCDFRGIVESASLPSNYSARAAELVALTRACDLAANQLVTIYTNSRRSS
ncbi:uncharacterized protein LOC130521569 [Takifugu flavidus]|uniref:uncharacterized protein LOC130521569 n=1 Tax=Takifugu flavidus TaxID=433684 RepID=UPI002544493C|nr:uncharacterized protein LOC130521569 [Takifugu flavidus]